LSPETVSALRDREAWAWEHVYRAYSRRLMGFLVVQLGSRDHASDALSDTFLRALKACRGFRGGPEQVPAWLFRIARNVAHDRQRARRQQPVPAEGPDRPDLSSHGPEGTAIVHDEAVRVRKALDGLDPEDREVLLLRVWGGLSSEEVGRILGKRPGAVRMQQHRALQVLAARMGQP
jgi:RNA polymerase sigma-70 factor (ECF subfamily)